MLITGYLPDCPDNTDVYINKPVGPYANINMKESGAKVMNHAFSIIVPLRELAIVIIENKYIKALSFSSPGDSENHKPLPHPDLQNAFCYSIWGMGF
ncbi:hypothetical protein GCM10022209_28340 [Chitinophaga oryziterrae]